MCVKESRPWGRAVDVLAGRIRICRHPRIQFAAREAWRGAVRRDS